MVPGGGFDPPSGFFSCQGTIAGGSLQVRKKPLQLEQEYVAAACQMSRALTRLYATGPGDTEAAMIRIEREHGLPYSALWALRYRPPKRISAAIFVAIRGVYRGVLERQRDKLSVEIEGLRQRGIGGDLVNEAAALVGETPMGEPIETAISDPDWQG